MGRSGGGGEARMKAEHVELLADDQAWIDKRELECSRDRTSKGRASSKR